MKVKMIQDGQLFCDRCQQPIPLGAKASTQVLVEFKRDSIDRHFCEKCMAHVRNPSALKSADGTGPK